MNRALGVLRRVSSLRLCGLIAADSCMNEASVDSLDYDGLGTVSYTHLTLPTKLEV